MLSKTDLARRVPVQPKQAQITESQSPGGPRPVNIPQKIVGHVEKYVEGLAMCERGRQYVGNTWEAWQYVSCRARLSCEGLIAKLPWLCLLIQSLHRNRTLSHPAQNTIPLLCSPTSPSAGFRFTKADEYIPPAFVRPLQLWQPSLRA